MTVYLASVNTGRYTFTALGGTEAHARDALMRAWRKHVRETGADRDALRADEVSVTSGVMGQAFRDGTPYGKATK